LERLEQELDNLRTALAWSQEQAGDPESGLRLAAALWSFWAVRGYWQEGRQWLAGLLELPGPAVPTLGRAQALLVAGGLAWDEGENERAASLCEQSLLMFRELGDKRGVANSLTSMGTVAYLQGDYAAARSLLEESLAIRRELGDKRGCAQCLAGLGGVAAGMGQAQAQTRAEAQVQRGATLLGAAEALLGAISAVLDPEDRMVYEQGVASARAKLGEAEFDKAWVEGRAMSLEQAIEYALQEDNSNG